MALPASANSLCILSNFPFASRPSDIEIRPASLWVSTYLSLIWFNKCLVGFNFFSKGKFYVVLHMWISFGNTRCLALRQLLGTDTFHCIVLETGAKHLNSPRGRHCLPQLMPWFAKNHSFWWKMGDGHVLTQPDKCNITERRVLSKAESPYSFFSFFHCF